VIANGPVPATLKLNVALLPVAFVWLTGCRVIVGDACAEADVLKSDSATVTRTPAALPRTKAPTFFI
jgi:hypothetical protein